MEAYELPIWPDLYEEKNLLLEENQLLYAVLQVDRREESLKISCRWLENLTKVNEQVIEACDKAFDRAKIQATRFTTQPKKIQLQEKEKPKAPPALFEMKLDVRQIRLSHILKIKECLQLHPGACPVKVHFYEGRRLLSTLHVSGGVNLSAALESTIQETIDCCSIGV